MYLHAHSTETIKRTIERGGGGENIQSCRLFFQLEIGQTKINGHRTDAFSVLASFYASAGAGLSNFRAMPQPVQYPGVVGHQVLLGTTKCNQFGKPMHRGLGLTGICALGIIIHICQRAVELSHHLGSLK